MSDSFPPTRLLTALLVVVAASISVIAPAATFAATADPSAHTASTSCPNVLFIGARGSGEKLEKASRGMGPAVSMMASAMEAALKPHNLTLLPEADPYPADPVADLVPSKDDAIAMAGGLDLVVAIAWKKGVDKYFKSIDTGISDAIVVVKREVGRCPGTSLVLAGYSQGAMVMHQAELQLADAHQTNLLNHIAGTLLLGDGDRVPNTRATEFGTSKRSGEGIRTYLHGIAQHDVESPANTANICDEEDIVCDFDPRKLMKDHNPFAIVAAFKHAAQVHTTYAASQGGLLKEAADWLAAKIIAADTPAAPPQAPPAPAPAPPAQPSPPSGEAGVVSFPGSPLTVSVGQLGQCQSSYEGSGDNYFPPDSNVGDCGFFLAFPGAGPGQPFALQGTTWGFEGLAGPHGLNLYTPVSQSPVTGAGTASEPYTETTVFKLLDDEGNDDALVSETTAYVNGATQFTSTYSVKNTTTDSIYFRAIYAGDLYVGGDDFGTGVFEASPPRFVGGENNDNGTIGGFLESGDLPWSSFEEGCWNDTSEEDEAENQGRCTGAEPSEAGIWHTVETTTEEPHAFNELTEPANVDNAMGVEWDQLREAGLPPGQEQAFKIVNVYRP